MPEPPGKGKLKIDFEPIGRRTEIRPGQNLLEAARSAGVELISLCGGIGSCDSCRIRVMEGELNPPTLEEKDIFEADALDAGYRLACQAVPSSNVKVGIPPESLATTQRLQLEGQEVEPTGEPVIRAIDLQIEPASLHDLRSDSTRLSEALRQAGQQVSRISVQVLRTISDDLRSNNWHVRALLRESRVVALLPEKTQFVGLAVDVGTTKLAGYLLDLDTGETLAKTGMMNPQISYGEDVVSRIAYTDANPGGREALQQLLAEALNSMLSKLCEEAGVDPNQIVEGAIVGNTAMHHLLIGLPVHQLAMAPYVPAVGEAIEVLAEELGLILAPGASIYFPPNIAGFVGADHVAMLLATELWRTEQTSIALDIGTNTEITLAHHGRLLSCSCASGPAFEGAHILDGMRAAAGAIERVQILQEEPKVYTIGEQAPVGICGSGILDAVAAMIEAGIIDRRGAIQAASPRVRQGAGRKHQEYLLVPASESGHGRDIVVSRADVNEIQLAKGAIRAGIDILLEEAGIHAPDLQAFIVAGAFGTYLDIDSAITVGMFPDLPRTRFRQVGNAAGTGARQMLLSAAQRKAGEQIQSRVEYIELTVHPEFESRFTQALFFN